MSRPPAIARVLDRCDVCGKAIHRRELVRTQVRYMKPAATNLLPYSSYSASGWACDDAEDESTIGIGTHADKTRTRLSAANAVSIINGVQTWKNKGCFRTSTAVNVSSGTTVTVSAVVAPYYQSTLPSLSVEAGLCDSAGNNKTAEITRTINTMRRLWYTVDTADIASPLSAAAAYFYWTITPETDQYWHIEDAQVETDATGGRPGEFVATSGAAVTTLVDTKTMTVRKVCPDCYEPLFVESERYGRHEKEIEPAIPMDSQEV